MRIYIVFVIVHVQRVSVGVIVVKLFENNFTPILDIDTTCGVGYKTAL